MIEKRLSDCGKTVLTFGCHTDDCDLAYEPIREVRQFCFNRMCQKEACKRARVQRMLDKYLPRVLSSKDVYFMTLTSREFSSLNYKAKNELDYAFRQLVRFYGRATKKRERKIEGYIKVLEVVPKGTGLFYYHYHVIYRGSELPSKLELNQKWFDYTGHSYITHLEEIRSSVGCLEYATKYISKGFDVPLTVKQYWKIRNMRFVSCVNMPVNEKFVMHSNHFNCNSCYSRLKPL